MALQVFLLFWMPTPEQAYVLYIASGFWGASDAIWQTLVNGKKYLNFIGSSKIDLGLPAQQANCRMSIRNFFQ